MSYIWKYTEHAVNDLKLLDRLVAQRILKKVAYFCTQENPLVHAKSLKGPFAGVLRFRIGDYRVLFRQESSGELVLLLILRVKHRSDVYA